MSLTNQLGKDDEDIQWRDCWTKPNVGPKQANEWPNSMKVKLWWKTPYDFLILIFNELFKFKISDELGVILCTKGINL